VHHQIGELTKGWKTNRGDMGKRNRQRIVAWGSCLFALGIGSLWCCWPHARLNVILVTLDTTRADHIGCYGYRGALTPALDGLSARGVVFERAYAPVPLTLPSHASMLTGLYPPEHGLHVNGMGRLSSDIPVLAEILRDLKYDTGAFLSAFVLNSKFGLDRGFQTYDDDLSETAQADSFVHRRRDGRSVMGAALDWLQRRGSRPFFCWIHLYDPHGAYDARQSVFGGRFVQQPYDAGIAAEDVQLRRLAEFLKSSGLAGQTLVVVVGDHGEGLWEHQEREHGLLLYESVVRVPLIVAGPRFVKAGHRVPTAVSLVDLMPTVLDCLSVGPKIPMSGRSLKQSLSGEDLEDRPCYAETDAPFEHHWAPLRAVITSRYKYIRTTRQELYDLIDDPRETRNLAQADATKRDELGAALDELLARFVPRVAGAVHLSTKEQQILASLGYTGGKRAGPPSDAVESLPDVKDMLPLYNMVLDARALLAGRQAPAALEKIDAILKLAPDYHEARVLLGDALMSQKRYSEAAGVYESVLAENPDQPTAHAHLADALAAQGRPQDAILHFRRALAIDSEAASWHLHLAQVLSSLGNPQEAVSEYEEAIRCDPGFVKAHLELGGLLTQLGQHEGAIGHFEVAIRLHPGLAGAHLNLGAALAQVNRSEEALLQTRKAVELDPDNFEARFNLGTMLMMHRRFHDAIVQFDEALRLRPDDLRPREHRERARAAIQAQGG
jgi:arylsulfatase A-like enzyme/Flp pilus assembly protein TadD